MMIVVDVRSKINLAMANQDNLVLAIRYKSSKGEVTERVISPVRWLNRLAFTALCLGREGCRTFRIDRCESAELKPAGDVLMPVAIETGKEVDANSAEA
jgi:predicted DNA-binding transcriptional regulator YafY